MNKILAIVATLMMTLQTQASELLLSDGWRMQRSDQVTLDGRTLTTAKVNVKKWYEAQVPSTVMGTLTRNGLYQGVLEGTAYRDIDRTPFDQGWWYRREFTLDGLSAAEHVTLCLDGIGYRANVWLNGVLVAAKDTLCGPFRRYALDVTGIAARHNTLAIEVFRAQPGEPNIGFVDWNPRPADESMGLVRPVRIVRSGAVTLSDGSVDAKLDTATLQEAWLTVRATVSNLTDETVSGQLRGTFDGRTFTADLTLRPREQCQVAVSGLDALHVVSPRLWWSHDLGTPELYDMRLEFVAGGQVSDTEQFAFGIREVSDYYTAEGHRGFLLNGRPVLMRGAGWTDDIFLRDTPETNELQVRYVCDMNLNCIRFENIWGTTQNIYDLCDRYGLLVLTGWSCQWEWKEYLGKPIDERYGGITSPEDIALISRSFRDQVCWLRRHPSIIAWFTGSDLLPHPDLERRYRDILAQTDNRPYLISAGNTRSELSGSSGMKMAGPYDYVGPNYWYSPEAPGGAFGFNTETGIGAQLPQRESLERMLGRDLWPLSDVWSYHCTASASAMNTLGRLSQVISGRYGDPTGLDDFLRKADLTNYDGARAMFEAFRANEPRATGIVQWMLNAARPSLYWQLYDHYLVPNAAYYSVRKGNAPVQLVYDYVRHTVYGVNAQLSQRPLQATMRLYALDGRLLSERSVPLSLVPGTVVKAFDLPSLAAVDGGCAFLFLSLTEADGTPVADNVYALSATDDAYDWRTSDWYKVDFTRYADFTPLAASLPEAQVEVVASDYADGCLTLRLRNQSPVVAFFIRLAAKDAQGGLIVPAFWSDNYLSIPPQGELTVTCRVARRPAAVSVEGWNVH